MSPTAPAAAQRHRSRSARRSSGGPPLVSRQASLDHRHHEPCRSAGGPARARDADRARLQLRPLRCGVREVVRRALRARRWRRESGRWRLGRNSWWGDGRRSSCRRTVRRWWSLGRSSRRRGEGRRSSGRRAVRRRSERGRNGRRRSECGWDGRRRNECRWRSSRRRGECRWWSSRRRRGECGRRSRRRRSSSRRRSNGRRCSECGWRRGRRSNGRRNSGRCRDLRRTSSRRSDRWRSRSRRGSGCWRKCGRRVLQTGERTVHGTHGLLLWDLCWGCERPLFRAGRMRAPGRRRASVCRRNGLLPAGWRSAPVLFRPDDVALARCCVRSSLHAGSTTVPPA